MHDVAAHVGVSIATVSRALTGSRPMSQELRAQVLAAADSLGYRVNLLGRALRVRRTFSLGLVVPDLENPFFSALAQQVSRSFSRSNIDVFVYSADNDIELERRGIQSFLGRQVDGLVIIPSSETDSEDNVLLADRHVVTVQFDRSVRSAPVRYVGCDNRHGIKLVLEHLHRDVDLARQPPIFIGAEPTSSSAHERLDAFTKAMPEAQRLLGSFSFGWGQEAAHLLIDQGTVAREAPVELIEDPLEVGLVQRRHICVVQCARFLVKGQPLAVEHPNSRRHRRRLLREVLTTQPEHLVRRGRDRAELPLQFVDL